MSTRVGVCGHSSLLAAQIMHIRDAKPEVWSKAGRVQLASSFLASILAGVVAPIVESDASGTGLFSLSKEQWDDAVLQAVGGEITQDLLGPIERTSSKPVGTLSSYFSQKYGLEPSAWLLLHFLLLNCIAMRCVAILFLAKLELTNDPLAFLAQTSPYSRLLLNTSPPIFPYVLPPPTVSSILGRAMSSSLPPQKLSLQDFLLPSHTLRRTRVRSASL